MNFLKIKNFFLDLFFPKFCLNCQREGSYLCLDCQGLLEIQKENFCPVCQKRALNFKTCRNCQRKTNLNGFFFALNYENPLIKKLIHKFKYDPFIKDLAEILADLIISHLTLVEFKFPENSIFLPIPLTKRRLKWRGFNQAEEIGKYLSSYYQIPIFNDVLVRKKFNLPQAELSGKERIENVKDAFSCQNQEKIWRKKVFLIDDLSTTGATLEEAAKILKENGAREIFGLVVAKG